MLQILGTHSSSSKMKRVYRSEIRSDRYYIMYLSSPDTFYDRKVAPLNRKKEVAFFKATSGAYCTDFRHISRGMRFRLKSNWSLNNLRRIPCQFGGLMIKGIYELEDHEVMMEFDIL